MYLTKETGFNIIIDDQDSNEIASFIECDYTEEMFGFDCSGPV